MLRKACRCAQRGIAGTASATYATSPAITGLLKGVCLPACLLAGGTKWPKEVSSPHGTGTCRVLGRTWPAGQPTGHSRLTKPPLARVSTKEQGLHSPRSSSFLCVTQAHLAGAECLKRDWLLLTSLILSSFCPTKT